ncbi:DUF1254 domain-containing protein [Streptomyces uncialis]|uniref:DUF1254 domain-containing protein n=1 Tax=Streptomyces uncialis TaxID=1048205 RepID=UPI003824F322
MRDAAGEARHRHRALTTPYIVNFTSLADGPVLIDYPAGPTAGGVLDFWQRPVVDLGQTGPDQGNGAG